MADRDQASWWKGFSGFVAEGRSFANARDNKTGLWWVGT